MTNLFLLPVTSATIDQIYTYKIEVSDADALEVSVNSKPHWQKSDGEFTLSGKFEGDDYGIGSLLTDAEILNDGWRSSKWFGLFKENGTNWIYRWLYVPDQSSSQIFLLRKTWLGLDIWIWIPRSPTEVFESDDDSSYIDQSFQIETAGTFPFLYSYETKDWLRFDENRSPAHFYDYETNKWIESFKYKVLVTSSTSFGGTVTEVDLVRGLF